MSSRTTRYKSSEELQEKTIAERNAASIRADMRGWLGPDVYSTAWVALVPDLADNTRPTWPAALDYLRRNQLEDGGWGTPHIYYPHERTIATLAAIRALHAWGPSPADAQRIHKGWLALHAYATDLAGVIKEPIGFEILLPSLREELSAYESYMPLSGWAAIEHLGREKRARISKLHPEPGNVQTWWFSMEMLPEEQLARLRPEDILDSNGSVATSTASTAAYLRALRQSGKNAPQAAAYLERMLDMGDGCVPVGWPFELFERIWVLDAFRRAGMDPTLPTIAAMANSIRDSWFLNEPGLSYSDVFPINDGDETIVGFEVLNWAGIYVPDAPVLSFWHEDHFLTYLDERGSSVSLNVHALSALRSQPHFPHAELARKISGWLVSHMDGQTLFNDKWHLSPYYTVAHAIPAFLGWDDGIAARCVQFLIDAQRADGGWGMSHSTLEETAHCVLALLPAYHSNLLDQRDALVKANRFFESKAGRVPVEPLWIGKTLYHPGSIVDANVCAARYALAKANLGSLAQCKRA